MAYQARRRRFPRSALSAVNMSEVVVESVSSPAMPVNAKRKLDASKPDAAATGDGSKNKTKSALGGLQTKQVCWSHMSSTSRGETVRSLAPRAQVSKMEKLLAAEKKKAEVDAKKQKKEADAAEKPKPTQKPLSKLDRIVQRENAQKEAKKVQGHDHAARTAPTRTHVPCAGGG